MKEFIQYLVPGACKGKERLTVDSKIYSQLLGLAGRIRRRSWL